MSNQEDIKTASHRVVNRTPGHVTFGVWVDGGKAGDLVVGVEHEIAMRHLLTSGGFLPSENNKPLDQDD